MSDTNFVIIGIMRRGDFDGTSSELHVHDDGVSDDWDASGEEWVDGEFPMQMLVSRVVGVDSDGGISEHSLGTCGGDYDSLVCNSVNFDTAP